MMSGADSTTGPGADSRLLPLLETLQDPAASPGALTDALLTLVNRLTGEEGKAFATEIEKHVPQLYKIFKVHIPTENSELSSAALQALGFCMFHPKIASQLCEEEIQELLSIVNSVAVTSLDKNTRTRALWVIAKQSFPPEAVRKVVPSIITMLETVLTKGDLQSTVVEHEALNVVIRLQEQAPVQMGEEAVRWAKLIIPLVVHSAQKVQLKGATALEMGVPLLLQKQQEVAAITEELMTTKIIPELQKLFTSKNETYVLKLWPLFVKLLGKALHRSGSFINSLLQLEELGFRSGSPVVKKIAFIAWKSLIDNFALNPEILCSAKRLKLLMQPLSSIHVRTEGLALTKLEVWWYLLMRLGSQLTAHFEQVCVPLIQSTLSLDFTMVQGNSSRLAANQSVTTLGAAHKTGAFPFGSPATPRMNLNSSVGGVGAIPSIQLLGIEMLLHFFMGPDVLSLIKENKIALSLEPLQHAVISSPSFFCKHAGTFINAVQDGFIAVGKDASDIILNAVWKEMIGFVRAAIESGSKKERQSSEVLTLLLLALKNIVLSNELPVLKLLSLIEITIKDLPPKVLGSPAYQVANMDLLNGTPALFLIQLFFRKDLLECCVQDERFFQNYECLVQFVFSGPSSPLAFSESVFTVVNQSAKYLENKEHLWRIWSIVVNPLTDWIIQTNEVNQGDALEHNFSAVYSALLFPVSHIFPACEFPQPTMKTLLRSWSELYRAFARCASLVATAEDNLCCEELCAKVMSGLEDEKHLSQSMLDGLSHVVSVLVDCINFAPYGTKYQPSNKSPQPPTDWSKKKRDPLGKLSSFFKLLILLIQSLRMIWSKESSPSKLVPVGATVLGVLQNTVGHISLPSVIRVVFRAFTKPVADLYEKIKSADSSSKVNNSLNNKFEKLLAESLNCLQCHYTGSFDNELLQEFFPLLCIMFLHKSKQLRSQAAQFWNATFGNATMLTYPEELKSVLRQAKQKILLSLPGFENIELEADCNGTHSDSAENSQWLTKISGIEVKPVGLNYLLVQASKLKEKPVTNSLVTPAKMKLEHSLPKANPKDILLEEENTVDFVFIPPEAKERVLTEHQKEVLRTKRVDIPAMYNNLDASQDTTLFSQCTQSQEDSLEKPALVEKKEEGHEEEETKTTSQNEKVRSDLPCIPHEASENRESNGHLEENCSTDIEQLKALGKESPRLHCENSKMHGLKPSPGGQSVVDASSLSESTSNDSSSSVSSDVISGTPQPLRRRQSFITLEKFDSSGNRPFSLSPFSNALGISGTSPLLGRQESTGASAKGKTNVEKKSAPKSKSEETLPRTKRSCLENINTLETYSKVKKIKEENKATSKLQSESKLGIKRSSPRQNKPELPQDKESNLMQSEQEKNVYVFSAKCVEDKYSLCGETHEAECVLDIPSQAPDLKMIGNTTTDNKMILDNVAELKAGQSLDCKENTPPEVVELGGEVSCISPIPQVSPNQRTLRRSLRRKLDISEGTADGQDKEHSLQKTDRSRDDDKLLLKKVHHSKESASQKQRSASEENVDAQGLENTKESHVAESVGSKESQTPRPQEETKKVHQSKESASQKQKSASEENVDAQGLENTKESHVAESIGSKESRTPQPPQEETKVIPRKSEGSTTSEMDVSQGCDSDTMGRKPKGLQRYQTRRTSQGLLSRIESSESDNFETREEGAKRKRSGRWKNKRNYLERQVKEELESQRQEFHSQEIAVTIQTNLVDKNDVMNSEGCTEVTLDSENRCKRDTNDSSFNQCSGVKEVGGVALCQIDSNMEQTAADRLAGPSSEPLSKSSQSSGISDKQGSASSFRANSLADCSEDARIPISHAFPTPEKLSEKPECQHKRSKRMRKSKSCECCDETPSTLVKPQAQLTKADSLEPTLTEHEEVLGQAIEAALNISAAEVAHMEEKLDLEPCATSTPLPPSVESGLKGSSIEVPRDDSVEGDRELAHAGSERCKLVPETLDCDGQAGATSEQSYPECDSKESILQCIDLEASQEPTLVRKIHQNLQLEERTDAEMDNHQPEEIRNSEPTSDNLEERENTAMAFVKEVAAPQDYGVDEEESKEMDAATALVEPELPAFIKDEAKAGDNLNSPVKFKEFDALALAKIGESPNGVQARFTWSPSASPSTSILKRGLKRQQQEDSLSPANKSRRVSFANPIYQEELADNIDRRSPVVRLNISPSHSIKPSSHYQAKHITTPVKRSLSPGSPSHTYKSPKKCLIAEMVKEPLPPPTESIYPALVGCKAPIDTILPQITSNIWARGLGQLIRAKNIRTVGDLSSLTPEEIKTLPIRSPKVSNVKRALRGYHEQQVKSRGSEEVAVPDDTEKPVNGIHEKPFSAIENKLVTDPSEPVASNVAEEAVTDLFAQINVLSAQITSENLDNYSGNELFDMQEKLHSMTNCIMKNLQSRWKSPSLESSV